MTWTDDQAEEADDTDKRGKRHYVGTKNNYTDEDIARLEEWAQSRCTYFVYGKEIGKNTGTPHLQIYMEFENTISMKTIVKKLFPMWLGYRRGTPKEAAGYCKKGSDTLGPYDNDATYAIFFPRTVEKPETWDLGGEWGTISQQGKRTDIDEAVEMLVHEKRTIREVARQCPAQFVKYHRGFAALRGMVLPPRCLPQNPEVIVLWGPTETGKSRDARIKYWPDEPYYVWKPSNGHWWDQYDGEMKVIIEEFRSSMPWSDLLCLLDRNECRCPVKGGFVEIQADKFIICSPTHPRTWYSDDKYDSVAQLMRRITHIYEHTPLQIVIQER